MAAERSTTTRVDSGPDQTRKPWTSALCTPNDALPSTTQSSWHDRNLDFNPHLSLDEPIMFTNSLANFNIYL